MNKTACLLGVASALLLAAPVAAEANPDYYRYCKVVTAESMRVFVDSTSTQEKWPGYRLQRNQRVFAAQEANGRYHVSINDQSGDYNGWISANPAYTNPC